MVPLVVQIKKNPKKIIKSFQLFAIIQATPHTEIGLFVHIYSYAYTHTRIYILTNGQMLKTSAIN